MNDTRKTSNTQVAAHLNQQGAALNAVTAFEEKAKQWFATNGKRLRSLCGNEDDARRLLIAALNSVQRIPSIVECSFDSWTLCLLQSAEYRLYPGAMGECAFVPFRNNRKGTTDATFVLQYQGVCQLLYRSGMVKDIEADIVCEKDDFEYKRGSSRELVFNPYDGPLEERGEWIGAYCIIRNIFGGEHIKFMTAREIMAIKNRSRASGSKESPWNSEHAGDRAWMWMKTALKQCAKLAPRSATTSSIAAALAIDDDSEDAPKPLDIGVAGRAAMGGFSRVEISAPVQNIPIPAMVGAANEISIPEPATPHGADRA